MEEKVVNSVETTDSWEWSKIIKHVILPKPKGSPKAGKKEIGARAGIGATFGLIAFSLFSSGGLPTCDSSDAKNLVGQIIDDMPLVKMSGAQFISLKDVSEQGFNEKSEVRSCTGTLVTSAGEDSVQYSVKWQNKKKSTFYVDARIL